MVGVSSAPVSPTLTGVLRWPAVSAVVLALVVFFLLGGPLCLRAEGRRLPARRRHPATLGDQLVFGWKDLLTTLPPVDGDGPLLVLPWVLGLATGWSAGYFAARVRAGAAARRAPAGGAVALLATVILLGVRRPQSLWVQGARSACSRSAGSRCAPSARPGRCRGGSGRVRRLVGGAALVGVAGRSPCRSPPGPRRRRRRARRAAQLRRAAVRRRAVPLAARARSAATWSCPRSPTRSTCTTRCSSRSKVPRRAPVRIATLDHYDGAVWGAANDALPAAPPTPSSASPRPSTTRSRASSST